ncbi:WGR domain-containing protein, partial [Microbispora triticiradicis]
MLTYVGGGSAKFWEVRQDGTELNIRYGRLGAAGQTQVKSFGSAAAATVAADKLVAEKLRKGYAEDEAAAAPVTSPPVTSPPVTSPPATSPAEIAAEDEDRLTMPAAWLRALHPRRGGVKVTVKRPDPGAPAELAARVDGQRQLIRDSLAKCSDPEIAAAGAAYLAGEPTPLGAAVAASVVAESVPWNERTSLTLFADAWLAERGPVFAATAVIELASLGLDATVYPRPVRRLATDESVNHWYGRPWMEIANRVRAVLSTAPDDEYAEVVAALAASREDGLHQRVAASYLAPTEVEWVTDDCAEVSRVNPDLALELVAAVGTPEHAALIASHVQGYYSMHSLALPATLVDGIGTAAVPVLAGWFDDLYDAESRRRLLSVLAELPSDAAMRALLDRIDHKHAEPAFLRAAARFPRRAMRMLAASGGTSGGKVPDTLLRAHVLAHPGLVDEVLASVDATAAGRINKITAAPSVPVAPLDALPEVLVSPPWTRPRTVRKPVVVNDLVCTDEPAVVWRPGERDTWSSARPEHRSWDRSRHEWKKVASRIAAQIAAGGQTPSYAFDEIALFVAGPDELAAPLIGKWRPGDLWGVSEWMPQVAARFGPAALPMMLDSARRAPVQVAPLLLPFAGPEIAVLMAEWLSRLKSVRASALAWLARHPETAARALIPAALGRPGVPRRQAERALAVLAAGGGRDAVTEAAAGY